MTLKLRSDSTHSTNVYCYTSVISLAVTAILASSVSASDFTHAQKVYVPPTNYDRRIDFSSIREQYTLPDGKKGKGSKTGSKTSSTHGKTTTKTASAKPGTAKPGEKPATTTKTAIAKPAVKTVAATPKPTTPVAGIPVSKSISAFNSKAPSNILAHMKLTAQELQKTGKLEEAQRVLTKVAQMAPEDKANLQQLAIVGVLRSKSYLKANNFQGALMQARTALSAVPTDPEANQILGELYRKVGADPNDVNNRLKTANTLYQQARYPEAEVEFKASLAIKPTPDAQVGIGKVFEKLNGPGAGKPYFEHAIELDSNSGAAHRELGMIHLHGGDVVSANSELSRAVIIDQTDKDASSNLVKLWQNQVSKIPNANSHLGLARAYQLSGELQSAQAEYREVVRIDPNHPYLPAARQSFKIALAKQEAEKSIAAAHNLESQGLINDAYQKASEAVSYSPGNSNYKIYQGELLEKLGQAGMAKQVYLNVLKDDPQNLVAVQKIKLLPNIAAVGMSAAGLAQSLLPGGMNTAKQPAGFPGTKFPMDSTADSTSLSSSAAGVAPVDQVGVLSSFMGQLRNQMLGSKGQNQKAEDAAHAVIKQLTDPDPPAAEPSASTGGGGGASAPGASLPADIKSLLGGSAAPSAMAPASAAEGGAAAALANAAAALAAIKGGGAAPAAASAAPVAKAMSGSSKSASQKLQELEMQNQQLKSQLSQMNNSPTGAAGATADSSAGGLSALAAPAALAAPSALSASPQVPATAPDYANFSAAPSSSGLSQQMPPISPTAQFQSPASMAPGQLPYSIDQMTAPAVTPATSSAPDLHSAIPSPAADGLRGPLASASPVRFELKEIKPTLRDVQLKVSLHNDTNAPIGIPGNLQAVIKYNNQTEAEMKVAFDDKTIAPHGTVDGVVKVPFNKVDPSADLVLRNMIPSSELHIIKTAISQK